MRKLSTTILAFFTFLPLAYSQEELVEFLPAGRADATILISGYIEPLADAGMVSIHGGWYTQGKVHRKLGVEFNVVANTRFIPSDQELFGVTNSQLTNTLISPSNPFGTDFPTTYGPEGTDPLLEFNDGSLDDGAIFEGPDGNDISDDFLINAVIVPTFQLTVGTVKGTDLKIRFTPDFGIDSDVEFTTFGIGLMHNIKQHIPGLDLAPFDLSLFAAYSRMDGEIDLSGEFAGTNQISEFDVDGFTVQVVGSKKVSVVTGYLGVGYYTSDAEFNVQGDYILTPGTFVGSGTGTYALLDDHSINLDGNPIVLNYEKSGIRATIGLRLKFGPITLHSDYTLQKNNLLTFGVGFSVRED